MGINLQRGADRKHRFMPQKSAPAPNAIKASLTDHSIGTNLTRPAEITGIVLDYAI